MCPEGRIRRSYADGCAGGSSTRKRQGVWAPSGRAPRAPRAGPSSSTTAPPGTSRGRRTGAPGRGGSRGRRASCLGLSPLSGRRCGTRRSVVSPCERQVGGEAMELKVGIASRSSRNRPSGGRGWASSRRWCGRHLLFAIAFAGTTGTRASTPLLRGAASRRAEQEGVGQELTGGHRKGTAARTGPTTVPSSRLSRRRRVRGGRRPVQPVIWRLDRLGRRWGDKRGYSLRHAKSSWKDRSLAVRLGAEGVRPELQQVGAQSQADPIRRPDLYQDAEGRARSRSQSGCLTCPSPDVAWR